MVVTLTESWPKQVLDPMKYHITHQLVSLIIIPYIYFNQIDTRMSSLLQWLLICLFDTLVDILQKILIENWEVIIVTKFWEKTCQIVADLVNFKIMSKIFTKFWLETVQLSNFVLIKSKGIWGIASWYSCRISICDPYPSTV